MTDPDDARLWEALNSIQATMALQAVLISRFSSALADLEDRVAIMAKTVNRPDLARPSPQRIAEVEARVRELGEVEAQVRAARTPGERP